MFALFIGILFHTAWNYRFSYTCSSVLLICKMCSHTCCWAKCHETISFQQQSFEYLYYPYIKLLLNLFLYRFLAFNSIGCWKRSMAPIILCDYDAQRLPFNWGISSQVKMSTVCVWQPLGFFTVYPIHIGRESSMTFP